VITFMQGEEEGIDQAGDRFNGLIKQGPKLGFTGDVLLHTGQRGPKKPKESSLKPAKNKSKTHLLPKHAHRARPALRWPPRPTGVAQSKAPSSGFCLARGLRPP
jgi:hypothetical protein